MKSKRRTTSPEIIEVLVELLFILAGLCCLVPGLIYGNIVLIVVGIILLAIGGICVIVFHYDGDDNGSSGSGGSFGGGASRGGGSSFFDFDFF